MIGFTFEQRKELSRMRNEQPLNPGRTEHLRPVTLETIARHETANKLLFDGLMYHYFQCVSTGKLDVWAKAAHAAVDLIASSDRVPFVKRSELD